MKVKMILPALTAAQSPSYRHIKYSLFPPLGLASLAGYLDDTDDIEIVDEHVETLSLNDSPALVVIEVYITNAYRAYQIADHYRARGSYVCLGGVHTTALPDEAAAHADSIFLGPGEDTWWKFLVDFRQGIPQPVYQSHTRVLAGLPPVRRDLIKRNRYLCPNAITVSRGCPHRCDFCYRECFYKGGKGYYTMNMERALGQIEALPGRQVFFLDDHLFGDERFAEELFEGMRGMGKLWQAAGTVKSVLTPGLLEKAVDAGLRSLFIGFESLSERNLRSMHMYHNIHRDYERAIRRLHDNGVMVNARFVFGLDHDDKDVFRRTVDWAVKQGIEASTFHVSTPYPGTRLHQRLKKQGRIISDNWDLYDTRHAIFKPANMCCAELENGYERAYSDFYSWSNIFKAAKEQATVARQLRHLAYAIGWRKCERLWAFIVKSGQVRRMVPLLETILKSTGPAPQHRKQPYAPLQTHNTPAQPALI